MLFLFLEAGIATGQPAKCAADDYDCRIKDYQAQIKADPKDVEAYYNLGLMYQKKGDYTSSLAMFDIYISTGTSNPEYLADGYNNRGFSLAHLGKDSLAVKDYTKAIELFSTNALFYANRGASYNTLKSFNLAVDDFTKAIGMKSDNSSWYFGRGFAYMELKNYVKALPDFTKVMALNPGDAEAYYNRGTIYYRTREYTKAISDLDKYIGLNQAHPQFMADGYENRGLAHFYLGNTQKAIDDFTKTIELDPKAKSAYGNRAMAYRKIGKVALAAADEKKAATLKDQ